MDNLVDIAQSARWALELCSLTAIGYAIIAGLIEILPGLLRRQTVAPDFAAEIVTCNVALGLDLLLIAAILACSSSPGADAVARVGLLALLRIVFCLLVVRMSVGRGGAEPGFGSA